MFDSLPDWVKNLGVGIGIILGILITSGACVPQYY